MNKYYYELTVIPDSYYELYLDLIEDIVDEAIEELDNSIIIRSEESLETIKNGVDTFTLELSKAFKTQIKCQTTLEKKENIDWIQAYKDSVQAVEVGEFYIHPSWQKSKDGKLNILIDPALTFGSGHHETTSTCLESISKYVKNSNTVLDVGCGSGILAIAASKKNAIVDICDTDNVAVVDALKNFDDNNVSCNDSWEGSSNNTTKTYDIVIANIVADVLVMINKDLKKVTKNNGIIILSGIMVKHKSKVLKKFDTYELIDEILKNEWVTLVVRKKEKNND